MKHTLLIKDWLGSFLSLFFPVIALFVAERWRKVKNVFAQCVISIFHVQIIILEKTIR